MLVKYLKIIPFLKSLLNRNSLKIGVFFDGVLQFARREKFFQKLTFLTPDTNCYVCILGGQKYNFFRKQLCAINRRFS